MQHAPKAPYYITTPIYYVNDKPHIGHAYTTLACDVLARFKRLDGHVVHFLTGTDEHGQKVEKSAAARGIDPQTYCDEYSAHFRDLADAMHYSHDQFIRTTDVAHKTAVQGFWQRIVEQGRLEGQEYIYLGNYAGWYAVRDEAFYTEGELTTGANGEKLAPTGAPVEWVEEPSYFFRLSAFQDRLLQYYAENPAFIAPESRRNEVIRFVEGGLKDLSISRTSFQWGVPVPGNEKHIMYVWLDALYNYVSALGGPDADAYQTFWPADIHMVGKDILRFHAVYWPAFLMAANMPLPKRIVAHGWWTNEGQKISKSLGNVISPYDLVEEFGLDQVRYFMLREVPFGQDGNYSRQGMITRVNSELANTIGNLAQRTLSMIVKNLNGVMPERCDIQEVDAMLLNRAYGLLPQLRQHLDEQEFHVALEAIVDVARHANEYIDAQAPWKLKKENPARMGDVLYNLAECIRCIALALQPFVPDAAAHLLNQLNVDEDKRGMFALHASHALQPGMILAAPQGVFPRFEEKSGEAA